MLPQGAMTSVYPTHEEKGKMAYFHLQKLA